MDVFSLEKQEENWKVWKIVWQKNLLRRKNMIIYWYFNLLWNELMLIVSDAKKLWFKILRKVWKIVSRNNFPRKKRVTRISRGISCDTNILKVCRHTKRYFWWQWRIQKFWMIGCAKCLLSFPLESHLNVFINIFLSTSSGS